MSIYEQITGMGQDFQDFRKRGGFTPQLHGILGEIGEAASYFLSPRGRQAAMNVAEVGDMINPVAGISRSGQQFSEGDYVGAMTEVAGILIPTAIVARFGPQTALAAGKAIQETLTGTGDSMGQVGADVYEAFIRRMNQPGPAPNALGSNFGNVPLVPAKNLRERYSRILREASEGKDPQRIKLTPERMEKAKEIASRDFNPEYFADQKQYEEWQKYLKTPTEQLTAAKEFASLALASGEKIRFRLPDGERGSIYVRVGDKGTVRFADHAQPTEYNNKGDLVPVGGFSTKLNRRHGVATVSVDPESKISVSKAFEKIFDNATNDGILPNIADAQLGGNNGPTLVNQLGDVSSVDLPEGSLPQYTGAAPNRTEPYQRYRPKNTTERMQRLEASVADPDNPINQIFDDHIEKGIKLSGPDWYNTEELRDWFISILGDKDGDAQWHEFMELIGTTSTGAKVPQNIRMASFYRALAPEDRAAVAQLVKDEGITPKKAADRLGVLPANTPDNYGYGHLKQRNQAGNVVNREAGAWDREVPEDLTGAALSKFLQANPKVKGFGNDLLGDDTNIAADMHFMRMLAMADGGGDFLNNQAKLSAENAAIAAEAIGPKKIKKYTTTRKVNGKPVSEINLFKAWQDGHIEDTSVFQKMPTAWSDTPKANEYAAYEDMANRVAEAYGMTPAQFQASLWMGAGEMTGLADESQGTFMNLFRRSLDKRAEERGLSRKEMLLDFLQNKAPLAVGPMGVLGALQMQGEERGGI